MPRPPRRTPVNRSRFAILGALTIAPMSGYDLRRFFEENLAFLWSESYGQIYPILRDLKAEGLVEEAPPEAGAGRRREYRITPAGRTALADWIAAPVTFVPGRIEILLKLFFARQAAPGTAEAHIAAFRAEHRERLARYAAVEERLRTELAAFPDNVYWRMTLAYGRLGSEAMLAWCDEAERLLRDAR